MSQAQIVMLIEDDGSTREHLATLPLHDRIYAPDPKQTHLLVPVAYERGFEPDEHGVPVYMRAEWTGLSRRNVPVEAEAGRPR